MNTTRRAIVVVDLGFGDAGKGTVVDYLARRDATHTVVRFNGGGQAAHNVITPDGRQHTFAQFGSGSFVPGVRTHLSRFMLVDPLSLVAEAAHLEAVGVADPLGLVTIDSAALVVTPLHVALNRLRELARGDGRHGSCGLGIGETMADALAHPADAVRAGDLADPPTVRRKVGALRERLLVTLAGFAAALPDTEAVHRERRPLFDPAIGDLCADLYADFTHQVALVDGDHLGRLLRRPGTIIFEGAQGVLLDERYGFHPYTTWSTTTTANADTLLAEAGYDGEVSRLGVLRTYSTRHGAGPFVAEDAALTAALPDRHNGHNPWQRTFRVGPLDLVATRYALAAAGPIDALAVTHLDRLPALAPWPVCRAYDYAGSASDLTDLFVHDGTTITDLTVPHRPRRDWQAALTDRLGRCRPLVDTVRRGGPASADADPAACCAYLAEHLGRPVVLRSSGPTAADKSLTSQPLHMAVSSAAR